MLLSKIEIQNFKCIKELSLDLKPLTIIVGPNGSGKTSVLEAIAMFDQSIERGIDKTSKDDIVNFEEEADMFYNRDTKNKLSLGFNIELQGNEVNEILAHLEKLKEIMEAWVNELSKDSATELQYNLALQILNELDTIKSEIFHSKTMGYSHGVRTNAERHYYHSLSFGQFKIEGEFIGSYTHWERIEGVDIYISNYSNFLPINFRLSIKGRQLEFDKLIEIFKRRIKDRKGKKIFYISSNRGVFPWEYAAVGAEDVGFKGEHTIEIISKILASRNFTIINDLEWFATLFGIPKVWTGWIRKGDILTSSYIDPITGASPLKFPHLGYGSKQILPIIVQLVKNEAGTLTLIEEPEISMHPEYQTLLPFLFAHAVNKGQQLIITTQSSYLPLALGRAIQGEKLTTKKYGVPEEREIKLDRENVAVYQMQRDEKGIKLDLLELDKDGFLKRGIPTFIKVEKDLFGRIFS